MRAGAGGAALVVTLGLLLVPGSDALVAQESAACVAAAGKEGSPSATPSPSGTRLFLVPTGRTLSGGCREVGAFHFLFPYVSWAPVDGVAATVGTPLFPGLFGRFLYVGGKVGLVRTPRLSVAAGGFGVAQIETFSFDADLLEGAFAYAVATLGGRDRAVTGGLAFRCDFAPLRCADGPSPAVLLGGEAVLVTNADPTASRSALRLLVEGYIFPGDEGALARERVLVLPGLRFESGRVGIEIFPTLMDDREGLTFPELPLFSFTLVF